MKWQRGMAAVAAVACGACALFAGCGESGAPDPEKVKGEEVTQEEWTSAFDFSERTNFSVQFVTETGGVQTQDTAKFDGDKMYLVSESYENSAEGTEPKKVTDEYYQEKSGDTYYEYIYNKEGKTWEKRESEDPYSPEDLIGELVPDLSFSDFHYDATAKAYVGVVTQAGAPINASVKIKGGKLSVVKLSITVGTYSVTYTASYYNYGSTKVTLPKVKAEGEGGNGSATNPDNPYTVSDSAWKAALSENAFTNVTIEASGMGTIKIADGKIHMRVVNYVSDSEGGTTTAYIDNYYETVNGVTYVYAQDENGTWTKVPAPEGNGILDFILPSITAFQNSKSAFTYDEAKQAYTASTITINVMGVDTTLTDVTLKFRDGKLTSLTAGSTFTFSDYGTTVVNLPVVAAE